jgi:LmbE family N-acetylglucosaminyl deacetylase
MNNKDSKTAVVNNSKNVAIIVAHPDDEILWAGGTILNNPHWHCYILALCRASDPDRAPKFYHVLKILGADGNMADLDDGPLQKPLDSDVVTRAILDGLPPMSYDLVISHDPKGEYTRHLRHEEAGKAVIRLWSTETISARKLWTFAYEDGGKKYLPRPIENAAIYQKLSSSVWEKKYKLITETYGFGKDSFEAKTTPLAEAFWQFSNHHDALQWINNTYI